MEVEQINAIINSLDGISKSISESNGSDFSLTVISILINIVLASVVIIQLFLYRDEINIRLRPWLGSEKGLNFDINSKYLEFWYSNYGQMMANNVLERWNISDKINSREDIIKNVKGEKIKSVTFPNHARKFSFTILDNPIVQKAIKENGSFYLEITINYEFGKGKKGFYGIVEEYQIKGRGIVIDEWAY